MRSAFEGMALGAEEIRWGERVEMGSGWVERDSTNFRARRVL